MAEIKYSEDGTVLEKASGLTGHFIIPNSVSKIGKSAFKGCTGLTSIEIPNSVTKIGDWAFDGCKRAKVIAVG